jgi:2-dehydropantoate 2-reductase
MDHFALPDAISLGVILMNILVFGAGALGSLSAVRLFQTGHHVSVPARGKRLAALRRGGLTLDSVKSGRRTFAKVSVAEHAGPDNEFDFVLVAGPNDQRPSLSTRRGPHV